ncbi:MAG: ferrous iron transport protein A [Candidatus Margulisbacteria bacterium]|nr:ferrous iron transport protein A [Candidatus Margulisiibacteriota bacterium]
MIAQLNELKEGDHAEIIKIEGVGEIRQRLLEMGLIPGVHLYLIRVAPLGDPIEISVHGFYLSLRKEEAALVKVEKCPMHRKCRRRGGGGWHQGKGYGFGRGRRHGSSKKD